MTINSIQDAANAIALSKLAADNKARAMLKPGTYEVDTTVRVTGQIKVGQDCQFTPTVAIPLKETLALFIKYCGATREAAIEALTKAMNESIALDGKGEGALIEAMPIIEQTMETVQSQIIDKLPKQTRKGSVTHKLNIAYINSPDTTMEVDVSKIEQPA